MAITYVNSNSAGGTANTVSTAALDNLTGVADFLVGAQGWYYAFAAGPTVTDDATSPANTPYVNRTKYTDSAQGATRLSYFLNPHVTATQIMTAAGTNSFPSLVQGSFKGVHLTAAYDDERGNNGGAGLTSLIASSTTDLTPSENGCLVLLVCVWAANVTSIGIDDANFSLIPNGHVDYLASNHFGVSLYYSIQTTAAAVNPTVSWTTATNASIAMASFKPAAAGAGTFRRSPRATLFGVG